MKKNYLITIIGPTAIGKTKLAIDLAKHFNCDILSSDSRQFFKEMNIGTAVPSLEELSTIKHHFIQHISINESYNVGEYEREALQKLKQLFQKNNIQIIVGGSGLYIDSILKGFDNFPTVLENFLNEVKNNFEEKGIDYLQKELQNLDINYFNYLKENNPQTLYNPQRLIRFVSVCKSSGLPYSSFLNQNKNTRNFIPILIGLEAERDLIYKRINERVDLMIENGLLKEAKNLHQYKDLNALQTVGYKELFDYFEEKYTLKESIELIKTNTRRFSKRQMTWFKKKENVIWFNFDTDIESIVKKIKSLMVLIE
jgi:tRNA dimethylallyltransferase